MKILKFIFVGKARHPSYADLEKEYFAKILRSVRGSLLLHVKDSAESNLVLRKQKESAAFLQQVPANAALVLCEEEGKAFHSLHFAKTLQTLLDAHAQIVLGVGGAYGFADDVKARANLCLRLAPWTLPHELARVVLLEQVYRALSIHRGEKYHHE